MASRRAPWLRFLPALLLVLLGAGGGLAYTSLATPQYSASAFVVVTATPPTGDRRDVSFAQAYGRVVGQQDVAKAAGEAVGMAPADVIEAVQARTSPDAPLIEITGTAPTAQGAADVVNAVANGLVAFAAGSTEATSVSLSVLSVATPPADPSSPNLTLDLAVGTATGVLLGALYLLATGGGRRRDTVTGLDAGPAPGPSGPTPWPGHRAAPPYAGPPVGPAPWGGSGPPAVPPHVPPQAPRPVPQPAEGETIRVQHWPFGRPRR